MGENDVVRHRELYNVRDDLRREIDQLRADHVDRFKRVEADVKALEDEHDTDMDTLATQRSTELQKASERRQQHREWTWGQVIATVAAAAAVAGFWLQALGH